MTEDKILTKIYFHLEDDWHGSKTESLWAEQLDENIFKLNNVPFYAKGVSLNDEVLTEYEDYLFYFKKVLKKSGHSTYRIILSLDTTDESFQKYWIPMEGLGCTYEKGKGRLYSIDIPSKVDIYVAYDLLRDGEKAEVWDFEEGDCGHPLKG